MTWERKTGTEQRAEARARVRVVRSAEQGTYSVGYNEFKRKVREKFGRKARKHKVAKALHGLAYDYIVERD